MYLAPALHSFIGPETRTSYTGRLLALGSCVAVRSSRIPTVLRTISTPLKVEEWERALVGHPDKDLVGYVLSEIRDGLRVGFDDSKYTCVSARANLRSAGENRQVVAVADPGGGGGGGGTPGARAPPPPPPPPSKFLDPPLTVEDYLKEECAQGRIIRMGMPEAVEGLHFSPFGVIPKGQQTGKWQLIVDLSFPHGRSVNDGINSELCTLSYISVDDVAKTILALGRGALMAKVDIRNA